VLRGFLLLFVLSLGVLPSECALAFAVQCEKQDGNENSIKNPKRRKKWFVMLTLQS
jgi:hypothetical protein